MDFKILIIVHKTKPINRDSQAMALKVGALQSFDVGASIGDRGLVGRGLEKIVETFESTNSKKNEKGVVWFFFSLGGQVPTWYATTRHVTTR